MRKYIKPQNAIAILITACSLLSITAYAHKYETATETEMKPTTQNGEANGIDYSAEPVCIDADSIE